MKFDTRGMQASGMTQQQINDLIKQKNADMSGRRGMDPKGYDVKPQVMPSVKPSVKPRINQSELQKAYGDVFRQASGANKPQVMPPVKPNPVPKPSVSAPYAYPNPKSIPKKGASVPDYLKPGYAGLQGTPAPNSGPRAPGAPNPIPQSILGIMKKGGEVKKYAKGGKINLDACGVSTAQKSKSSPKW